MLAFKHMRILVEPANVLFRVKRGLAGYVSYLAACEMNQAFSEYVLYEPILRILTARNYKVECEYECPDVQHALVGDKRRIDFVAQHRQSSTRFAMEVKWARSYRPSILRDVEKLAAFKSHFPTSSSLLCIFGRRSDIEKVQLQPGRFEERGEGVYADFRNTKYGCRIFELDCS
jgi:hypothetical protein